MSRAWPRSRPLDRPPLSPGSRSCRVGRVAAALVLVNVAERRADRFVFEWQHLVTSEHGPASPTARLVLLVLSLYANTITRDAFPSIATLAARSGLSRKAVIQHLAEAHAAGWFSRSSLGKAGKGWRRWSYTLTVPSHIPEGGYRRLPARGDGGNPGSHIVVTDGDTNLPMNSGPIYRKESIFEGEAPWKD